MSLLTTVARNVRVFRTQRKLTQAAVANAAGLSVSYISMLERGQRSPLLGTLVTLANALRVTPDVLVQEASGRVPSRRRSTKPRSR
jgi:transcriptional regulator with XRE-family HTH domain